MPELDSASTTDVTGSESTPNPAGEQAPAASESSTPVVKELEVVHEGAPVPIEGEVYDDGQTDEGTEGESTDKSRDNAADKSDDTKTEGQPREEKKRGADARIRDLVANEKVYKDVIKSLNPDYDIEAAVKNGVTPESARLDAFEHNQAVEKLTESVARVNTDLQQQADDIGEKYSFMDGNRTDRTPEEITRANDIMDLWFDAAKPVFVKDKDGNPILDGKGNLIFESAATPLYDFVDKIMTINNSHVQQATAEAEKTGQRNAEIKIAAVEVPTPRTPRTDRSNDDSLSADEYAKQHGLKTV